MPEFIWMKALFISLLLLSLAARAFSQESSRIDTPLNFNRRYTQCELKWVLLPKPDKTQRYIYGMVYIDERAGFTLFVQGNLWIDKNGRYIADTTFLHHNPMRMRLSRNTANMALLPSARFAELNINPKPDWLNDYYTYTDTVAHNFRRGFIFNDRGQSDSAMVYLNKVYEVQPHYKGLIFELIFAHNALGDYNGAIKIIQLALQTDQLNDLYYRELGYAYSKINNYEKAIMAYLAGINLCTTESQMNEKAEMAINLAGVYKSYGNDDQYRLWGAKAKTWAKPGTDVYNFIASQRF
jgi:tetratricopeptide (TPR) repeat protein